MSTVVEDIRIVAQQTLTPPDQFKLGLSLTTAQASFVQKARQQVADIIHGRDPRLLVITGPCSIHDPVAALQYAEKLKLLQQRYQDSLYIVMRVYFEKPRTTVGWKGFINDPHLDDSFDIETGLTKARRLLLALTDLGLPCASEALDPISPQYLSDLLAWAAIGARTVESQTHREMASGLSMPVGFKNGTDGNLAIALNALQAAASRHSFIGINPQGQVALVQTAGNPDGHIILRGGKTPNYDAESMENTVQALQAAGVPQAIVVDCSHGNSNKDYRRQPAVARDVVAQRCRGNNAIIGIMLESHLIAGRQDLICGQPLTFGQSITDACIDWDTTDALLAELAAQMHALIYPC